MVEKIYGKYKNTRENTYKGQQLRQEIAVKQKEGKATR